MVPVFAHFNIGLASGTMIEMIVFKSRIEIFMRIVFVNTLEARDGDPSVTPHGNPSTVCTAERRTRCSAEVRKQPFALCECLKKALVANLTTQPSLDSDKSCW